MVLAFVFMTVLGAADDPTALASTLTKAITEGRWTDAATLATKLDRAIAAKAPLVVTSGHVLYEPPQGYGLYNAAADGVPKTDELILYAEVHEHVLRETTNGYELYLTSDLIVSDADGHELARDQHFGEQRFTAKAPHRDTFVTAALSTKGLPAGRYVVRWVIHDKVGDKVASIDIPFGVR
jgi:hypothetical protein